MTTLKAIDIFERPYFETKSEYRLAISLAMEGARRGIPLDFSGMKARSGLDSRVHAGYKNWLITNNLVLGATVLEEDEYPYENDDLSYLEMSNLFEDNGDFLYWDQNWSLEIIGSRYYEIANVSDMVYFLERLVCKHWMDHLLGIELRPLYLKFGSQLSATVMSYLHLESLRNSLPKMSKIFTLVLDERTNVDMKMSLFHFDAQNLGFNKEYSVDEKLSILDQKGFTEGMILVLFERKGINRSNSLGRIDMAHLVRVDEIVDGKLYLSLIRGTRTYEETAKDFEMIPEKNRHLYLDLLDTHESIYDSMVVELRECGIGNHFYREKYLIDSISTVDTITKLVSKNGEIFEQELNEADAIFYTLMQNSAPIDADLFCEYYFSGREPFWYSVSDTMAKSPLEFVPKDYLN